MPITNKLAGRMSHVGQHRLSRRKYAELVAFLKSVISNDKISVSTRMQAAVRLDSIYARYELAQLERERREDRIRTRVALAQASGEAGAVLTPAEAEAARRESEAEEAAKKLFERLLNTSTGETAARVTAKAAGVGEMTLEMEGNE